MKWRAFSGGVCPPSHIGDSKLAAVEGSDQSGTSHNVVLTVTRLANEIRCRAYDNLTPCVVR